MRLLDDLVDVGTALGKGVCSAGMDIVYGIERTGEGLGIRGADRVAQIGSENEYLAKLLVELLKHGVTTIQSPLFRIIVEILGILHESVYTFSWHFGRIKGSGVRGQG
jgi:hypothetical protein